MDMDVISAIRKLWKAESSTGEAAEPHTVEERKQSTAQAIARGAGKDADIEAEWLRLFRTEPNWNTKNNREIKLWLKDRPPEQTLERFARWWFESDFRGKQGSAPMTTWVRELWLKAFETNPQAPVTKAKDPTKRPGPLPKGV